MKTLNNNNNRLRENGRKGQEELVGFILVIVLVVVIFVVIFSFSMRKNSSSTFGKDSRDIYQFLESTMEVSSNYSVTGQFGTFDIITLIKCCNDPTPISCYHMLKDDACKAINITMKELLNSAWTVGPQRPTTGYIFKVVYLSENNIKQNADPEKINPFLLLPQGVCNNTQIFQNEYPISATPGRIIVSLKICSIANSN